MHSVMQLHYNTGPDNIPIFPILPSSPKSHHHTILTITLSSTLPHPHHHPNLTITPSSKLLNPHCQPILTIPLSRSCPHHPSILAMSSPPSILAMSSPSLYPRRVLTIITSIPQHPSLSGCCESQHLLLCPIEARRARRRRLGFQRKAGMAEVQDWRH